MNAPATITPPYKHTPLFPLGKDSTRYRKLDVEGLRVEKVMGRDMVVVPREALRALEEAAYVDITCAPGISPRCARSSTIRKRRPTTSSSPMIS